MRSLSRSKPSNATKGLTVHHHPTALPMTDPLYKQMAKKYVSVSLSVTEGTQNFR